MEMATDADDVGSAEGIPPVDIATWSAEDVAAWARSAEFPDGIAEKMLAEEVDGETLIAFESKQEVKEGLELPLGKANKVWQAIQKLKADSMSAPTTGGSASGGMVMIPCSPGSEAYTHADSLIQSSWTK
jgi:hypothetical protein